MAKNQNSQLDVNDALTKSEAFVIKYKKELIIGIAAIVILVGGFFLYRNFIAIPRADKASTMLAKGQTYFEAGDYDKALNGDGMGYTGFIKVADEYSSTDAGNLANLYAGLSYAQTGKTKEAIKYLEAYSECGDEMISPAAIGALGNCYAQEGQLDKAVETLKKAAAQADNNSLSPIYLIQAGEILESQNKAADAKTLYEEVKDKYFRSQAAQDIDKYIQRATK